MNVISGAIEFPLLEGFVTIFLGPRITFPSLSFIYLLGTTPSLDLASHEKRQ